MVPLVTIIKMHLCWGLIFGLCRCGADDTNFCVSQRTLTQSIVFLEIKNILGSMLLSISVVNNIFFVCECNLDKKHFQKIWCRRCFLFTEFYCCDELFSF